MSKSRGNVVDPFERLAVYSSDGLRYYLMKDGVAHSDGSLYFFYCWIFNYSEIYCCLVSVFCSHYLRCVCCCSCLNVNLFSGSLLTVDHCVTLCLLLQLFVNVNCSVVHCSLLTIAWRCVCCCSCLNVNLFSGSLLTVDHCVVWDAHF